jgi:UDP-glucose 4-epimerase
MCANYRASPSNRAFSVECPLHLRSSAFIGGFISSALSLLAAVMNSVPSDFYAGRRVCVTGGAGFIGSHLVDALVARGAVVNVIDDLCNGSLDNLRGVKDRIRFTLGSILDPHALDAAVDGCEIVFHEAAVGSVPRSVEEPARFTQVNAMGTLSVLEAARRSGERMKSKQRMPRVIYAASSSAYGDTPTLPKVERMPAQPRSPYAAAKLAGELLLQSHCACFDMTGVSLRYFNVFGPRQRADSMYAAVVPRFIDALRQNRRPLVHGDGTQSRDFTFIDNVVDANLLAGACGKPLRGEVINIACGERFTLLQLLDELKSIMRVNVQPEFAPTRAGDVMHSLADVSAARTLIGYAPEVGFEVGLRRMLTP